MRASQKGALLSGLVFPGAGQIALKHYKRGIALVFAVTIGMVAMVVKGVQVALAIDWYEKGMDFADALHLTSSCEANGFATMDARMSRKALQVAPMQNILLVK